MGQSAWDIATKLKGEMIEFHIPARTGPITLGGKEHSADDATIVCSDCGSQVFRLAKETLDDP